MADGIITPCNVACGIEIMTVNLPSGSTLQCDTWPWDDMPWNSPKHPPYWNFTSGFDFDHITPVDMSLCTSLRKFIQIGRSTLSRKNDVSRRRISAILDFKGPIMGSLKSQCTPSYRSSIDTIALNCLRFEKIPFLHFLTDRQIEEQMDSIDALSRSRCRERRLNNRPILVYDRSNSAIFNDLKFNDP